MAGEDDARTELIRRFEAAVSGAEFDDLRALAADPTGSRPPTRPELPRAPRDERVLYRVRVDLDDSDPLIWRRLDLRSDLSLDVVHDVLQLAFGWTDSHLHCFSLGGGPFDDHSQLFLCPFDVEEGDSDGIPAADVRLDQVLQQPGDHLRYLYDYGDSWELTLRLAEILPAHPDSPTATVVEGQRAAPPEDCGGITDADSLAEVLDDPAHFDADEINRALRSPYLVLRDHGVDERLVELVRRLHHTEVGTGLADRTPALVSARTVLHPAELTANLSAYQWFLNRAADGGIALTAAGYLTPADVAAASKVVPEMGDWTGSHNREVHCAPLLRLREAVVSMGLLRKHKGVLSLTHAGAAAQRDPAKLWNHLASRLLPSDGGTFEGQATMLLLAYAGTSESTVELALAQITDALTELGWRHRDDREINARELYRLQAFDVLRNVTDRPASRHDRYRISTAAATLARAALRRDQ